MRERTHLLNGTFCIDSAPGEGTTCRGHAANSGRRRSRDTVPFEVGEIANGLAYEEGLAERVSEASGGAVGHCREQ